MVPNVTCSIAIKKLMKFGGEGRGGGKMTFTEEYGTE